MKLHRRIQALLIVLEVILITGMLYVAEGRVSAAPVLRYLYLLPMAQAALAFSLTGSMMVALLADLLFVPLFATRLAQNGVLAGPTLELAVTLVLLPVLAYFAGSSWGRLSRQRELYQFLSDMGDLFGRSLPREALLRQLLEQGAGLIEAAGGEIVLVDGARAEVAASWGITAKASAPYTHSLAHYVVTHNRTWSTMNLEYDTTFERVSAGPRIDAAVVVPLRLGGKSVGALAFYNRPGGFGRHEQAAVEAMGGKVSVVLENYQHIQALAERERLQREFSLAAEVQSRFLPTAVPEIGGYEIVGRTLPAREIGGDFFCFVPLQAPHWYIAVGDVSGKGVVGAFFMAIATSLIDVQLRDQLVPATSALDTLNPWFYSRMSPQKHNTALGHLVLEPTSGQVRVGNAGLIAPLYRCSARATCDYVDVVGLPLGVVPKLAYTEQTLTLAPGDWLVLASDGVVEARNSSGAYFGLDTLRQLVASATATSATELLELIFSAVKEFCAAVEPHDDMTVLVIHRPPSAA